MRSNTELRNLAWKRLWADRWFGRLFGGGLLLSLCGYAVQVVLSGILGRLGAQSWFDYLQVSAQNRQDLTTPVPQLTPDFISQACSSTVLTLFFSFIMAGIAAYGGAVILRKCLANDDRNWLGEAFGGFKYPFGMLWLQLRYWLICLCWGILAGIPFGVALGISVPLVTHFAESYMLLTVAAEIVLMSLGTGAMLAIYCIPFYRYRFLWLVKAEHPDWSAGACMKSCRELMKGNMMKSFRLDCSYWKPITLVLLPMMAAVAAMLLVALLKDNKMLAALMALGGVMAVSASIAGGVVLAQYIGVGQGFLYQDLKDGQTTKQNERS